MGKRRTNEEFREEVYGLVGDEYTVITMFEGMNKKVKLRHNKEGCIHEYGVRPSDFIYKGRRCPNCNGNKRKTHEEIEERVKRLVGEDYTLLGRYKNMTTKVLMRHNNESCEFHEWDVNIKDFINSGSRCPMCNGNRAKQKTTKIFKQQVEDLVGEEYSVLGEYTTSGVSIEMKHNVCGRLYEVEPSSFLRGTRCSKCKGNMRKNTSQIKEELYNLVGDEYVLMSEYKNKNTKITIKHSECGNIIDMYISNFMRGNRCKYCSEGTKKTTYKYKKEVKELYGDEYKVLGAYEGSDRKILLKHTKCGTLYEARAGGLLAGKGCPICKSSKGERRIKRYLDKNKVKHKTEYRVCYNDTYGRVDFVILDEEGKIKLGIEFDGEQHYRPIGFFGGEESFKDRQYRDKLKDTYFKDKGIRMLRIPYWEYGNIDEILKEELEGGNSMNINTR